MSRYYIVFHACISMNRWKNISVGQVSNEFNYPSVHGAIGRTTGDHLGTGLPQKRRGAASALEILPRMGVARIPRGPSEPHARRCDTGYRRISGSDGAPRDRSRSMPLPIGPGTQPSGGLVHSVTIAGAVSAARATTCGRHADARRRLEVSLSQDAGVGGAPS